MPQESTLGPSECWIVQFESRNKTGLTVELEHCFSAREGEKKLIRSQIIAELSEIKECMIRFWALVIITDGPARLYRHIAYIALRLHALPNSDGLCVHYIIVHGKEYHRRPPLAGCAPWHISFLLLIVIIMQFTMPSGCLGARERPKNQMIGASIRDWL